MYLYVYMPLHVSVNNNHHQKAKQHRKKTTITWYKIHQIRLYRIFMLSQNVTVEVIIKFLIFKILSLIHQVQLIS
jgi:hypothetical protein